MGWGSCISESRSKGSREALVGAEDGLERRAGLTGEGAEGGGERVKALGGAGERGGGDGAILGASTLGLEGPGPKSPKGSSSNPFPLKFNGEAPAPESGVGGADGLAGLSPEAFFLRHSAQVSRPMTISRQSEQKGFWQLEQRPTARRSIWIVQEASATFGSFPKIVSPPAAGFPPVGTRRFPYFFKAIKSISMEAFFGRAATCTTARAGGSFGKRSVRTLFRFSNSPKSVR